MISILLKRKKKIFLEKWSPWQRPIMAVLEKNGPYAGQYLEKTTHHIPMKFCESRN